MPTIGLNVKVSIPSYLYHYHFARLNLRQVVKKGNTVIKCWDIAGQAKFRGEWSRYARGCDVIVFGAYLLHMSIVCASNFVFVAAVVDAADPSRMPSARKELHRLLEDVALANTPLLVCGT